MLKVYEKAQRKTWVSSSYLLLTGEIVDRPPRVGVGVPVEDSIWGEQSVLVDRRVLLLRVRLDLRLESSGFNLLSIAVDREF